MAKRSGRLEAGRRLGIQSFIARRFERTDTRDLGQQNEIGVVPGEDQLFARVGEGLCLNLGPAIVRIFSGDGMQDEIRQSGAFGEGFSGCRWRG